MLWHRRRESRLARPSPAKEDARGCRGSEGLEARVSLLCLLCMFLLLLLVGEEEGRCCSKETRKCGELTFGMSIHGDGQTNTRPMLNRHASRVVGGCSGCTYMVTLPSYLSSRPVEVVLCNLYGMRVLNNFRMHSNNYKASQSQGGR